MSDGGTEDDRKILAMYADLGIHHWMTLMMASRGGLEKMNGAQRAAMKDLLDGNALSPLGLEVLERVNRLMDEGMPEEEAQWIGKVNFSNASRSLKAHPRFRYLRAVHVKVLVDLRHRPGLAFGYLGALYGGGPCRMLLQTGFIQGDDRRGGTVRLTDLGMTALETAGLFAWDMPAAVGQAVTA
jgi:hypothetical protein